MQAEHVPVQATLQHKPSAMKPLRHWFGPVAGWPSGFCGAQLPALQYEVPAQSGSVAQPEVQVPPLHPAGAQLTALPGTHEPEPSHRLGCTSVLPTHAPAWQMVPAA